MLMSDVDTASREAWPTVTCRPTGWPGIGTVIFDRRRSAFLAELAPMYPVILRIMMIEQT